VPLKSAEAAYMAVESPPLSPKETPIPVSADQPPCVLETLPRQNSRAQKVAEIPKPLVAPEETPEQATALKPLPPPEPDVVTTVVKVTAPREVTVDIVDRVSDLGLDIECMSADTLYVINVGLVHS